MRYGVPLPLIQSLLEVETVMHDRCSWFANKANWRFRDSNGS